MFVIFGASARGGLTVILLGTARQFFLNRHDQSRVGRLNLRGEARRDVTVASDQVLVEVPAGQFERLFCRSPPIKRVLAWPPDLGLRGEREGDTVLLMRGLLDLGRAARLLRA